MRKRLHQCENCLAIYEDFQRAKNCHEGLVVSYECEFKRTTCDNAYKHCYTDKKTGERINNCYYCGKPKTKT